MICPICGANNPENVPFCSSCGAEMTPHSAFAIHEPAKNENGKGLAVTSLILGIIGLVLCPGLPSFLSLIFGIVAKKKGYNASGVATAGVVLGIIGIVISIITAIIMVVTGGALFTFLYEMIESSSGYNPYSYSSYSYY